MRRQWALPPAADRSDYFLEVSYYIAFVWTTAGCRASPRRLLVFPPPPLAGFDIDPRKRIRVHPMPKFDFNCWKSLREIQVRCCVCRYVYIIYLCFCSVWIFVCFVFDFPSPCVYCIGRTYSKLSSRQSRALSLLFILHFLASKLHYESNFYRRCDGGKHCQCMIWLMLRVFSLQLKRTFAMFTVKTLKKRWMMYFVM